MGSFADYWSSLVRSNPGLKDPKSTIRMSVSEFERLLKNAYSNGEQNSQRDDRPQSLFDVIFGK